MRIFEEKSKAARHAATPETAVAPDHPLLRLQRTIGNRATERMLEGFPEQKGLERSIARLKKVDARVGPPAKELMALLRAFFEKGTKTSAKLSKEQAATAGEELKRETGVSNVEDTVWPNTPLDWLLNPGNRPKKTKARPSLESPY